MLVGQTAVALRLGDDPLYELRRSIWSSLWLKIGKKMYENGECSQEQIADKMLG